MHTAELQKLVDLTRTLGDLSEEAARDAQTAQGRGDFNGAFGLYGKAAGFREAGYLVMALTQRELEAVS